MSNRAFIRLHGLKVMSLIFAVAVLAIATAFSPAHAIYRCTGDTNNDLVVNFTDLGELAHEFGACLECAADFDGDGRVNFTDLGTLTAHFFDRCEPAQTLLADSRCSLETPDGVRPRLTAHTHANGLLWPLTVAGEITVSELEQLDGYTVLQCWPIVNGRDHVTR